MTETPTTNSSCHSLDAARGLSSPQQQSILWLQIVTIVWMLIECAVSLVSAWKGHSPGLLAFGSDSLVELLSAAVVLLQLIPAIGLNSARANRYAGMLLYVLAGIVVVASILGWALGVRPETSRLGMLITVAALVVMPVLAWTKRGLARRMGNVALAADAVQSATCAYLAAITLAGLAANAVFHIQWVDSVAALLVVPLLLKEAKEAMRGEGCGCC